MILNIEVGSAKIAVKYIGHSLTTARIIKSNRKIGEEINQKETAFFLIDDRYNDEKMDMESFSKFLKWQQNEVPFMRKI